jgi:hypothetical protein
VCDTAEFSKIIYVVYAVTTVLQPIIVLWSFHVLAGLTVKKSAYPETN